MFKTAKSFLKDVWAERKRITWPTEKEMKSYSIQVVVFVAILAVFFFFVDAGVTQAMYLLSR